FVMRVSPSLVESMLDDPGAVHGTCHPTSAVGACNRSAECFVVPPLVQKLRRLTQPLHPARPPTRRNLSEWRGVPLAGRTNMKRIAINTGGGDAPGLNAVIRAVALSALSRGWEVLGIRRGYQGLVIDALVALGGDGSMTIARQLLARGLPRIIGVPKTIDNDIRGTDVTFGFATAVETTTEALGRLHSTAQSHQRVMVVEVMGRHAGWIALYSGIAGSADVILIPEIPYDMERVYEKIRQ